MQRKPGYPVANCNIKMPDSVPLSEAVPCDDDSDQQQRRQQLINFGHTQWGFNNWSWTVSKQDLDFVDFSSGKYCVGVAAFVCVSVKSLDIRRENVGYATCVAPGKGSAIHQARKCAVTNALRETLLSFGGAVASDLLEQLDARPEPAPQPEPENNPNVANVSANRPELKNAPSANLRKEAELGAPANRPPAVKNLPQPAGACRPPPAPVVPPAPGPPPPGPPAPGPAATGARPLRANSNEPRVDPEEEARAERRRRQRQAQEEFRLKQMMKQKTENQELGNGSSIDRLLLDIPTQDIVIDDSGKRKTPPPEGATKRRAVSRLDIVEAD